MSDLLEYFIHQKQKFFVEGNIDSMKEKNVKSLWNLIQPEKFVSLKLTLRQQCIINKIQFNALNTDKLTIQLFSTDGVLQQKKSRECIEKKNTIIQIKVFEKIKSVKLALENNYSAKMGLISFILKGKKKSSPQKNFYSNLVSEQSLGKKKKVDKNLLKSADRSPHQSYKVTNSKKQTEFFQQRKKLKENEESLELQQVLKASKKSYEKQQMNREIDLEEPRKYKISQMEKDKLDILKYVNTSWLQSQMKAQNQKNIQERYKLSKIVKVRHLHEKKIYIDGIYGPQRKKIQYLIEQLGAKIIESPLDYCLIISKSKLNLQKLKKFKNIKIIRSQYLQHCKKYQAKLSENDYLL